MGNKSNKTTVESGSHKRRREQRKANKWWCTFVDLQKGEEVTLYSEGEKKQKTINVKWKNEGQFWMFSGLFDKNNQNTNSG